MGRLFWKFFFSILLAQIAATVGIGGAIWLKNRDSAQQRRLDIDTSPPAEMAIEAAAATLDAAGPKALSRLLENMGRHRVYAVDGDGKELLGRIVDPAVLAKARATLDSGDTRVVRKVTLPNGHPYLLFLPARQRQGGLAVGDTRPLLAGTGLAGLGMDGPGPGRPPMDGPRPGSEPRDGARPPPGTPGPGGPGPYGPRFQPLTPFVPLAAALIASLLFAALLAWYFARPIRELRQAFEAASGGDLAPRFADSGKGSDELSALGRDFDRMTARLRSLMDGQTRLLHDVSHELRSPLARLQAAIGLAHQQPEKMVASMERIERESVRMDKLIGELLTLSRLEAAAVNPLSEDFSIADLLLDIVEDARYEAGGRQISISLSGDADIGEAIVTGQSDLLGRAVENVVRNAIKYSPDGGAVEVAASLLDGGRQVRIAVLDQGPGVGAADLAAIFEPFFRASTTQESTDGHGLGLAIAQHVIGAHGGTITASNRSGGGLSVEMILPAKLPG